MTHCNIQEITLPVWYPMHLKSKQKKTIKRNEHSSMIWGYDFSSPAVFYPIAIPYQMEKMSIIIYWGIFVFYTCKKLS